MMYLWNLTVSEWYDQVFFENADHRTHNLFLMRSPVPVIVLVMLYAYFVLSLGPRLMKNRPAFNLKMVMVIYNLTQIIICTFLIRKENILSISYRYTFPWMGEPVDYSDTQIGREIVSGIHDYFLLKIFDLLDTIFFVLRKKNEQVTFLHVYHHSVMILGTWVGVKYYAGGHGCFLGYINCYVHVIMYGYYLVTSLWPDHKQNIWWKKYVTVIQMCQFAANALHSLPLLMMEEVMYPKNMAGLIFVQNIFMFVLFLNFYRQTYLKKKIK